MPELTLELLLKEAKRRQANGEVEIDIADPDT